MGRKQQGQRSRLLINTFEGLGCEYWWPSGIESLRHFQFVCWLIECKTASLDKTRRQVSLQETEVLLGDFGIRRTKLRLALNSAQVLTELCEPTFPEFVHLGP